MINIKNMIQQKYLAVYEIAAAEKPDLFEMDNGKAILNKPWNEKKYTVSGEGIMKKQFSEKMDAIAYLTKNGYIYSRTWVGDEYINPDVAAIYHAAEQQCENIKNATIEIINGVTKILAENAEFSYIRFGLIPEDGRSYNFRDNHFEEGVSAYKAYKVGSVYVIDVAGSFFTYMGYVKSKKAYEINGEELNTTGSDGEPLLKNAVVVKTISNEKIMDIKTYINEIFK